MMAEDKAIKKAAQDSISRNNHTISSALQSSPAIFQQVVEKCAAQRIISPGEKNTYLDTCSTGQSLAYRTGLLVSNFRRTVGVVPNMLDDILCIFHESDSLNVQEAAKTIAKNYQFSLPKYRGLTCSQQQPSPPPPAVAQQPSPPPPAVAQQPSPPAVAYTGTRPARQGDRHNIMPSQPVEQIDYQGHPEPSQIAGTDDGTQLRQRPSHAATAPSNEANGTDGADTPPPPSNPSSSDYAAAANMSFGNIDILDLEFYEKLGRGSYGTVRRAKWKSRSKIVAVKEIQKQNDFKEAVLLSSLRHKHVIQFFGAVTNTPDYDCLVTEYARLGSLFDYLRDYTINFQQIITWAKQIALGMNYLHNKEPIRVIHRDLKSQNVVIAEGLIAKICDLGASKFYDHTTRMTNVGTYRWMAPEVFKNEKVSIASDVFSYSIILWEMWTCELPYKELENAQVIFKVGNNERLDVPGDCPPKYSKLIKQCWSEKPEDRPKFSQILLILENMTTDDIASLEANMGSLNTESDDDEVDTN